MNGESPARLMVVGVGGGRMMRAGLQGVELVAVNTDAQVLSIVQAHKHLQIGRKLTGGLGAGGDPEIGRLAAEESREEIADLLQGLDMVFITAGMGGGTGTGGAPIIAEVAKELGILTVAIVTRPFSFEGLARAQRAEVGIQNLSQNVDAIVTISKLKVAPPDMPLTQAFELVDEVLRQGVQGITDLITVPGLINLDFADVESVLRGAGTAMMGIGEAGRQLAVPSPHPSLMPRSRVPRRPSSTSRAGTISLWKKSLRRPASSTKPCRTGIPSPFW